MFIAEPGSSSRFFFVDFFAEPQICSWTIAEKQNAKYVHGASDAKSFLKRQKKFWREKNGGHRHEKKQEPEKQKPTTGETKTEPNNTPKRPPPLRYINGNTQKGHRQKLAGNQRNTDFYLSYLNNKKRPKATKTGTMKTETKEQEKREETRLQRSLAFLEKTAAEISSRLAATTEKTFLKAAANLKPYTNHNIIHI